MLAALAAVLLAPLAAVADEGDWYLAVSTMYFDDDGDRLIDDTFGGLQLQVGREMTERINEWVESCRRAAPYNISLFDTGALEKLKAMGYVR